MPIRLADAPAGGFDVIRSHVSHAVQLQSTSLTNTIASVETSILTLAQPHPIYLGFAENVADRTLLQHAQLVAWRYLVIEGDSIIHAAAELRHASESSSSSTLVYAGLHHGPHCGNLSDAILAAEKLPITAENDCELRILRVPAIFLFAIWLSADRDNVLIPVAPCPSALTAGNAYAESELSDALRPLAQVRLAMGDGEG